MATVDDNILAVQGRTSNSLYTYRCARCLVEFEIWGIEKKALAENLTRGNRAIVDYSVYAQRVECPKCGNMVASTPPELVAEQVLAWAQWNDPDNDYGTGGLTQGDSQTLRNLVVVPAARKFTDPVGASNTPLSDPADNKFEWFNCPRCAANFQMTVPYLIAEKSVQGNYVAAGAADNALGIPYWYVNCITCDFRIPLSSAQMVDLGLAYATTSPNPYYAVGGRVTDFNGDGVTSALVNIVEVTDETGVTPTGASFDPYPQPLATDPITGHGMFTVRRQASDTGKFFKISLSPTGTGLVGADPKYQFSPPFHVARFPVLNAAREAMLSSVSDADHWYDVAGTVCPQDVAGGTQWEIAADIPVPLRTHGFSFKAAAPQYCFIGRLADVDGLGNVAWSLSGIGPPVVIVYAWSILESRWIHLSAALTEYPPGSGFPVRGGACSYPFPDLPYWPAAPFNNFDDAIDTFTPPVALTGGVAETGFFAFVTPSNPYFSDDYKLVFLPNATTDPSGSFDMSTGADLFMHPSGRVMVDFAGNSFDYQTAVPTTTELLELDSSRYPTCYRFTAMMPVSVLDTTILVPGWVPYGFLSAPIFGPFYLGGYGSAGSTFRCGVEPSTETPDALYLYDHPAAGATGCDIIAPRVDRLYWRHYHGPTAAVANADPHFAHPGESPCQTGGDNPRPWFGFPTVPEKNDAGGGVPPPPRDRYNKYVLNYKLTEGTNHVTYLSTERIPDPDTHDAMLPGPYPINLPAIPGAPGSPDSSWWPWNANYVVGGANGADHDMMKCLDVSGWTTAENCPCILTIRAAPWGNPTLARDTYSRAIYKVQAGNLMIDPTSDVGNLYYEIPVGNLPTTGTVEVQIPVVTVTGTLTASPAAGGAATAVEGVTVRLYKDPKSEANLFATTTTDADGRYSIMGVPAGSWTLEFIKPRYGTWVATAATNWTSGFSFTLRPSLGCTASNGGRGNFYGSAHCNYQFAAIAKQNAPHDNPTGVAQIGGILPLTAGIPGCVDGFPHPAMLSVATYPTCATGEVDMDWDWFLDIEAAGASGGYDEVAKDDFLVLVDSRVPKKRDFDFSYVGSKSTIDITVKVFYPISDMNRLAVERMYCYLKQQGLPNGPNGCTDSTGTATLNDVPLGTTTGTSWTLVVAGAPPYSVEKEFVVYKTGLDPATFPNNTVEVAVGIQYRSNPSLYCPG